MHEHNGSPSLGSRTLQERRTTVADHLKANFSFASLLAILFLTFLDNTIASAVLTSVQAKLHAGVTQLQWVAGGLRQPHVDLWLARRQLRPQKGDVDWRRHLLRRIARLRVRLVAHFTHHPASNHGGWPRGVRAQPALDDSSQLPRQEGARASARRVGRGQWPRARPGTGDWWRARRTVVVARGLLVQLHLWRDRSLRRGHRATRE